MMTRTANPIIHESVNPTDPATRQAAGIPVYSGLFRVNPF